MRGPHSEQTRSARERRSRLCAALVAVGALAMMAACTTPEPAPRGGTARAALLPIALPDLSRTDPTVQAQARERQAALMQKVNDPAAATADLSAAYGEFGMFLHAAEAVEFAEAYYRNAQLLDPSDVRWPYYLGHLYKSLGDTAKSVEAFQRARELRPNDVAIMIWLGRLHHELGEEQDAEALFTLALSRAPGLVAALAGLGQTALARQDYATAAKYLEEALSQDPEAAAVHTPLAMAYRGLGDLDKAEAHLKQWRNREIAVPDPLREELDMSVESGLSYELRGVRALESQQWTLAADLFRKGAAITPATTPLGRSLRHKLGTALALNGDLSGALEQFEEVVRASPPDGYDEASAKANYSLGVIASSAGRSRQAIEHFTAAIRHNPHYVEAHIGLADALRREGRLEPSLSHYEDAIRISPRDAAYPRFGYAMALVRLGRYVEARDWLIEATRQHPENPDLANALARVLAAAPDDRVRDGRRAFAIVQELSKGDRTIVLGETAAMTLAEIGEFDEAVAVQRSVIDAAQRAGLQDLARLMRDNLRLYEKRQPSRTPWSPEDPVHRPGPSGEAAMLR